MDNSDVRSRTVIAAVEERLGPDRSKGRTGLLDLADFLQAGIAQPGKVITGMIG